MGLTNSEKQAPMLSLGKSHSSEESSLEHQGFTWETAMTSNKPQNEQDKDCSSPLLPKWNTERHPQPTLSRRNRFFRKHLGWLVACCLFLLLFLENGMIAWKNGVQERPASGVLHEEPVDTAQMKEVSGVTIVSGFFLLSNGRKHTPKEYWIWIRKFLENVEQPVVFYTSPDLLDRLQDMRGDKPITWNTDYTDAADMPPIQALGGREWAQAMRSLDPEAYKHVAGVYPPWTAKPWMVNQVKDSNPYNSEYFFWVDAGGFRERVAKHHFRGLVKRLEELYANLPGDTVVLADATLPWPEGQSGVQYAKDATEKGLMDRGDCHIQGGWYGGKAAGIQWWYEETLRITVLQSMLQRFAGKEQDIWTHVARLNYYRVAIQNNFRNAGIGSSCGRSPWFAYEYWADGPGCEIPLWNGPAESALELKSKTLAQAPESQDAAPSQYRQEHNR